MTCLSVLVLGFFVQEAILTLSCFLWPHDFLFWWMTSANCKMKSFDAESVQLEVRQTELQLSGSWSAPYVCNTNFYTEFQRWEETVKCILLMWCLCPTLHTFSGSFWFFSFWRTHYLWTCQYQNVTWPSLSAAAADALSPAKWAGCPASSAPPGWGWRGTGMKTRSMMGAPLPHGGWIWKGE